MSNTPQNPRNLWPIVIGGCHRSGTSLVRRMLNAHSRIFCGPEVKFFRDFYGAYKEDPIKHLRFTNTVRAILPEDQLLDILGKAFITVQQRAAEREGKARWADKDPSNVMYLNQWQQLLGNEWFMVHVVRNPLDTLASIKEVRFPLSLPPDLDGRIAFYQQHTQAGLDFGAAHPKRYYRVIYEDLVASPKSVMEKLMTWLGEQFEIEQLEFNKKPQHRGGLEDPKVAKTATVHGGSVSRWASILDQEEAEKIRVATDSLWAQIDPQGKYRAA